MAKDKNFDELKEWLILFLKHKDLFYKKIVDIKEKDGILIVEQKENTQYFAILPHLDVVDKLLDDYKDKQICIVTFNTKPNFDIIINPDKGDLEIWRNRVVVEDGKVEEENEEIPSTCAALARNAAGNPGL